MIQKRCVDLRVQCVVDRSGEIDSRDLGAKALGQRANFDFLVRHDGAFDSG